MLFTKEKYDRILDLRVWFDRIELFDTSQKRIKIQDFVEDEKRWREAFHSGDERASGMGMYPLKG